MDVTDQFIYYDVAQVGRSNNINGMWMNDTLLRNYICRAAINSELNLVLYTRVGGGNNIVELWCHRDLDAADPLSRDAHQKWHMCNEPTALQIFLQLKK